MIMIWYNSDGFDLHSNSWIMVLDLLLLCLGIIFVIIILIVFIFTIKTCNIIKILIKIMHV